MIKRVTNMALKKILPYLLLSALFALWLFSLLAVYLPITSWGTPTFPITINSNMKALFLASSIILALATFLFGIQKLGLFSRIGNFRGHHK
jgi:hypothetical protein